MNGLKAHMLNIPFGYKLVGLVIFPLLLIALRISYSAVGGELSTIIFVLNAMVMTFYMIVLVFGDFFCHGGLFAKGKERYDLFKNSDVGIQLLKQSFVVDLIIKFIFTFGLFGLLQIGTSIDLLSAISIGLFCYAGLLAGSFIARFMTIWSWVIFPSYLGAAFYGLGFFLTEILSWYIVAAVGVFVSVVFIVLIMWMLNRKIEDSYND